MFLWKAEQEISLQDSSNLLIREILSLAKSVRARTHLYMFYWLNYICKVIKRINNDTLIRQTMIQ